MIRIISTACVSLVLASFAVGQCPSWNAGFGPAGISDDVRDVVVFDDGGGPALYAGGHFGAASGAIAGGVARWDGTSWSALAGSIELSSDGTVLALDVFDFGGSAVLCVLGTFEGVAGVPASGVALWDGVAWDALGGGPPSELGIRPEIRCAAVFDGGAGEALFAAGTFELVDGVAGAVLARFDGSSWTPIAGTGPGGVRGGAWETVVHDDGSGAQIYMLGSFTGAPHARLIRWDGQQFSGTGSGPFDFPNRLSSLAAAAGVPAGLYTLPGRPSTSTGLLHLSRWNGVTWSPLDIPMGYPVDTHTFAIFDGGLGNELVVAGDFPRPIAGVPSANIARWTGTQWKAMGSTGYGLGGQWGSSGFVSDFAVHDDGTGKALHAAGEIVWSAGQPLANLARWNGAGWTAIPGFVLPYTTHVEEMISTDVAGGPKLWMAGDLKVGNMNPHAAASWNGSVMQGFLTSSEGVGFAVFDAGDGPELFLATEHSLYHWTNNTFTWVPGVSGTFGAIATHDDGSGTKLYLAGRFDSIAGVSAENIARFDGKTWEAVGPGIGEPGISNEQIEALLSIESGPDAGLYAGGAFANSGATPLSGLARWDGSAWNDVGGGVDGATTHFSSDGRRVLALEAFDDGSGCGPALYVGGNFESVAGGVPAHGLARFDGARWESADLTVEGALPTVRGLLSAYLPDLGSFLAVGGDFDGVGGVPAQRMALLEACEPGSLFCFGDGVLGTCPCGNSSAPGDQAGCRNSHGTAGELRAHGTARLSDDTLTFHGSGMLPTSPVLYFQAGTTHAPTPFGDGLKCTGGPFVRLLTKINQGGASTYPEAGDLPISLRGMVPEPGTRHYQARYRDPVNFCTPDNFNYTNAVTIVWGL